MTGPFLTPSASPGHQTTRSDQEYHLHHVKGQQENEDGSATGLLRGFDGGEGQEHASISASKAGQEKGKSRGDEDPINGQSNLDTRAARRTFKEPPAHRRNFFPPVTKRYLAIMVLFSSVALFAALRMGILFASTPPVGAVPVAPTTGSTAASNYWVSSIKRQGTVAFGDSSFKVFRNVQDYGAKGDGTTDSTDAINKAITDGSRCGKGCDSSTVTPAIVYFPPGTYLVSKPIVQLYYTQFIGDAVEPPTLKAAANFVGMAVIDSDPYDNTGANWYTNQNNFFRQVRNFVIDLTALPASQGAGIHWQVAQATSLQNIRFEMVKGGDANKQSGIFMDNGSGGFMTDLVFNGGNYGMFLGNQQFTTRNLTFTNVKTAVFMNWNWLWTLKSMDINNCGVGVNMSNSPANQTVGSVIIQDSKFRNTPIGVITAYSPSKNVPATGGTLVLDNVDFTGSTTAVQDDTGKAVLKGGSKVASWAQGHAYTTGAGLSANGTCTTGAAPATSSANVQGPLTAPTKPKALLDSSGALFEKSRPQYEYLPASSFVSVKSKGAKGDGKTDDTASIQATFDAATSEQVVYFDHGAYVISKTVKVPKDIKITGEMWPLIMASGPAFSDQNKPSPVFQVGQKGDVGAVEMSDLIFETKGSQPGAILMEFNVGASSQGASGLWDVHFRVGGTAGSGLQSDTCSKNPNVTATDFPKCDGAFMLLHITKSASAYVENSWLWVADHELDRADHNQIDIYNGRGLLVESQGPVWLYGTSSEHSQLYNYQFSHAKDIYAGLIQTETPYMQSNPISTKAFPPQAAYNDPTFDHCTTNSCKKAWGLRIVDSSDIIVSGAGLYSFFDNYDQTCLATESCQENMVSLEGCNQVYLWGLSTKASTNMVTVDGKGAADQKDNRSNFCSTLALFEEA